MEQFKFSAFHAWVVEYELAVIVFAKTIVLPDFVRIGTSFDRRLENVVRNAVLQINHTPVGLKSVTDSGRIVAFYEFNLLLIPEPFALGIKIIALYPELDKILLQGCKLCLAQLVVDERTLVNTGNRSH